MIAHCGCLFTKDYKSSDIERQATRTAFVYIAQTTWAAFFSDDLHGQGFA